MGEWVQLSQASSESLLQTISALTWPIETDSVPGIIASMDWKVTSSRPEVSYRAETNYGLNRPMATFTIVGSDLAEFSINTTDTVVDGGAEFQTFVRDAFAYQVKSVSSVLGSAAKRKAGKTPSVIWLLENGSRLTIKAIEYGCSWEVTSPKFVEIQSSL
ncbi:MAG: hypothetical protein JWM76_506 [Pseudonocardiales bacterium]|nr:hypothetical protein [Pseudonocardiales bacterium]